MRDVLFRLKTRDHCRHPADRSQDKSPEAHEPERFAFRGDRKDVKQCGPDEQGDGKIVQGGVQARPIVVQHGFSSQESGARSQELGGRAFGTPDSRLLTRNF
jgi:hypothetical protein